ncbi:hypothetical protein NQ317_016578 [Molorchus minor]|uniref:Uncharacterized protein n=1 Tax=Molorchus minor TaxID=1323400 RepID=A0ABQ9J825_9CUCU|nr:hypothetical protein NQ317_016578 [Molorchus minor]
MAVAECLCLANKAISVRKRGRPSLVMQNLQNKTRRGPTSDYPIHVPSHCQIQEKARGELTNVLRSQKGENCVILAEVQFEARGLQCAEDKIASLRMCTMNNCESEEIVEAANIAISNLLPTKSRSLYDIAYNRFKKWCAEKNVQVYSENVLLAYFSENAKNYKSSTLWAQYSMVKSCLIIYDNIDISKFPKLIAFFEKNR